MGRTKAASEEAQTRPQVEPMGEAPDGQESAPVTADPVVVLQTVHLHPDEIVVDADMNSRDATGDVSGLVASLLARGQEEPVWVRMVDGIPHLVFGYRRHKAALKINADGEYDHALWPDGWKLRAEMVECSDAQAFASNCAENHSRKDLTVVERARAMDRLINAFGWVQKDVARTFDCDRATVSRSLKLLTAPRPVLRLVGQGKATAEAVLEILGQPEEEQESAFEALSVEASEGRKATKSAVREKRKKSKAAAGEDEQADNKKLTLKQVRSFWERVRDGELPEGADVTQKTVAGWVVRYMDGRFGDRAMQSRLAMLRLDEI